MFEELSEKHGEEYVERAIEAVKAEENKDKEDFSESDWEWVGKLASKLEETDSDSTDDQANEEDLDDPEGDVPEEGSDETDTDELDLTDDDDTDGGDDEEMSQQDLTGDGEELESVEEAVESFMEDDCDLDDALEMIEV